MNFFFLIRIHLLEAFLTLLLGPTALIYEVILEMLREKAHSATLRTSLKLVVAFADVVDRFVIVVDAIAAGVVFAAELHVYQILFDVPMEIHELCPLSPIALLGACSDALRVHLIDTFLTIG